MAMQVYYCVYRDRHIERLLEDYIFDIGICAVQIDAHTGRVCGTFESLDHFLRLYPKAAVIKIH